MNKQIKLIIRIDDELKIKEFINFNNILFYDYTTKHIKRQYPIMSSPLKQIITIDYFRLTTNLFKPKMYKKPPVILSINF